MSKLAAKSYKITLNLIRYKWVYFNLIPLIRLTYFMCEQVQCSHKSPMEGQEILGKRWHSCLKIPDARALFIERRDRWEKSLSRSCRDLRVYLPLQPRERCPNRGEIDDRSRRSRKKRVALRDPRLVAERSTSHKIPGRPRDHRYENGPDAPARRGRCLNLEPGLT